MNTLDAFARGREARRNAPHMVFDWNKAAELIRKHKPKNASGGLRGDWEYTGGTIYVDGKPVTNSYTYLSSTWAVPELNMDGKKYECFVYEIGSEFRHDTKWPQSALDILNKQ